MKLFRSVFVSVCVLSFTFSQAQSVDEIVTKHIEAMGGKETINKVNSMIIQSDIEVMGISLSNTSTVLVGKGFKNVANFNGQEIIQCVTPTGGWTVNPLQGVPNPQSLPDDEVKAVQSALDSGDDFFEYKKKGSNVELLGRENLEGVNSHKLKLVDKNGVNIIFFIDPATYHVLRKESTAKVNGQDVTSVSVFSDYKKTDFGLVIPYTTITNQGVELTIKVKKVEFNQEIDPKIFEMPK